MAIPSERQPMQIEVLHFEGCPHHLPTMERIHIVLRQEHCNAEVRQILVPDAQEAQRLNFPGSPTVRINGIDIEPAAMNGRDYGLACRRYTGGIPSLDLIRLAVRSALDSGGEAP